MANLDHDELHRRLKRALAVGGDAYDARDIADAVGQGKMQAWVNGDSLVITEVVHYPRVSVVNIVIAVGRLAEVMALQPAIEDFAREHKCAALRMEGRKGWERVLPHHGWKADPKVIYERTLH